MKTWDEQMEERAAKALDMTHSHKSADKGKLKVAREALAKYLDMNIWMGGRLFLNYLMTVEKAAKEVEA